MLPKTLQYAALLIFLLATGWLHAEAINTKVIEVTLGDYRYFPDNIELIVEQPVILRLINGDSC